jgi:4-hydroxy-tetrahydrodipicolinate reductase
MKIALIGYGKMGKIIEKIAMENGHSVVLKTDIDNPIDTNLELLKTVDVAIEFTGPEIAFHNIKVCLENNIPTVSGSTGWMHLMPQIEKLTIQTNGSFFYASNYSIGVNIFFEINKKLATLMSNYPTYTAEIEEIHHTEKKDAPSGTAITLAEDLLAHNINYSKWKLDHALDSSDLLIKSKRMNPAPGTHHVRYTSDIDDIEIIHTAHNRIGFATGALIAAEWLANKKGVFNMKDLLGIN